MIVPGLLAPPAVCMSTCDGQETKLYLAKDCIPPFREALKVGIIGANLSFDLAVAAAYDSSVLPAIFEALDQNRVYDVQLIEALHQNTTDSFYLDPHTKAPLKHGYSLAYLETKHLGIDRSAQKAGPDVWRLRYAELDGIPLDQWPSEAKEYALADAQGTWRVFERQRERVEAEPNTNWHCIHDEVRSAFALHLMACWGMRTDEALVQKTAHEIRTAHEESRKRFLAAGLVKVRRARGGKKPETPDFEQDGLQMKYQTDSKAVMRMVEKAYQGDPPRTAKDRISYSRDTLTNSGDPLLEEFGESGENEKNFSTYIGVLELGTKIPVNARYRSLLKTGRTSCSAPNFQNLPRRGPIRECHIPRSGWVYASVDYATQESVCLAQVQLAWCKESALADAINAGDDIHLRTASAFCGRSYEDLFAHRKDPEVKKIRQASKPGTFGVPGLLGPPGLVMNARGSYDVRFCEYIDGGDCFDHPRVTQYYRRPIAPTCERCLELAIDIRKGMLETFPETQTVMDVCVELFEDGECLPLLGNGMLIKATDKPGTYCNGVFQGLAAQISKRALYEVEVQSYIGKGVLRGNCRPVGVFHDELFCEVREVVASECALEIQRIMEEVMRRYTPGVRVKAEPALQRRWFKGAEPVQAKNGKLKPWWPAEWKWGPDQEIMRKDLEA